MDKRQTAIDWLVKEFNLEEYEATIKLAKSMEKEQIIEAYEQGESEWTPFEFKTAQDYYTSTYGQ